MRSPLLSGSFELCRQYLRGVQGYSDATLSNYERTWQQYLAYLRGQHLSDEVRHFTVETVMGFCDDLASRGAVPNTILNKMHGLSTLARFLMKRPGPGGRPLLAANPTLGFERPRGTTPETKYLYPAELQQFMGCPATSSLDLARRLFLDTGIRCLEAVEANVGDLRQMGGDWYLSIRVKGRRQKGGEPASIPVSPEIAEAIQETWPERDASAPLLSADGSGMRRWTRPQLTQAMIRLGQRAGITRLTASPHRIRHTTNVVARMSGVDALTRAAMLNHRSMRTLARYDHLVPGETTKGRAQQQSFMAAYLQGQS